MRIQLPLVQWVALVATLVASTRAAAISSSPGEHGLAVRSVQTTGTLEPPPTRSLTKRSPVYPDDVLKQAANHVKNIEAQLTQIHPDPIFFHPPHSFNAKIEDFGLKKSAFYLFPHDQGPWTFSYDGAGRFSLRAREGIALSPKARDDLRKLANHRVRLDQHRSGPFLVKFNPDRYEKAHYISVLDEHGALHLVPPTVDPLVRPDFNVASAPAPLPPHRPRPNAVYRGPTLRPQRPVEAEIDDWRRTQSGREATQPPSPSSFGNSESTRSSRQASLASRRSQSSLSRSERADSRRSLR